MTTTRLEQLAKEFQEHLGQIDELTLVVLKGHLLIEESLDKIISTFVFHPEMLEPARLSFAQRVAIARAISLDEHENSMWELVLAINTLRNDLAHNLRSPRRVQRTERVFSLLDHESRNAEGPSPQLPAGPEHGRMAVAIALSLGFLSSFQAEVERFKDLVSTLDGAVNPHRYEGGASAP